MSWQHEAPPHWSRFLSLVKTRCPVMPQTGMTQMQRDRQSAADAYSVLGTLLSALGHSLPGELDNAVTLLTNEDRLAALQSIAQAEAVSALAGSATGGLIVGNGIELLRGAYQSLNRSDQMVGYLLGMTAYTTTLSRLCISAMRDQVPYMRRPEPRVPEYILRLGDLFSAWRREAYDLGYEAAWSVVQEMDAVTPANDRRGHYSKQALLYIFLQTGFTGQHQDMDWRARQQCEDIILRRILATNLLEQRQTLARWARSR